MTDAPSELAEVLEDCFRAEWPALVGAAARITGDLGRAEEIVQDVLAGALARWPFTGVPERPAAWLLTATRNRARNAVRDRAREETRMVRASEAAATSEPDDARSPIADDRLRLVFLCCHPTLTVEARVALTLRLVGALSTRQIARAFLQPEATVAQRIVRAKRALAEAGARLDVPPRDEWVDRLPAVLGVLYLVFNEGYLAAEGPGLTRRELCLEALRLGRLLTELLPDQSEVHGLVALMELQASRLDARTDASGELVLLADQDRCHWDRGRLAAGEAALTVAQQLGPPGPLTLQAAIAACHARAATFEATDWPAIVTLYDRLLSVAPSPVVALNRVVAIAMRDGPGAGLSALDPLIAGGGLADYHLLWATRADLLNRCGRPMEAIGDYRRALALATNPSEQRHLRARIAECRTEDFGTG